MLLLVVVLIVLQVLRGSNGQGVGAVRLVKHIQWPYEVTESAGIVQIYYGHQWGNIYLHDNFTSVEADVICHQLRYTSAVEYGRAGDAIAIYGRDSAPTLITDVACDSKDYLVLLSQCSYSECDYHSLGNGYEDLYIQCYTTRLWDDNPYNGQIRLIDGELSNKGRLEVYCNGEWGTVCNEHFGMKDANFVCAQLGYNTYMAFSNPSYNDVDLVYAQMKGKSPQPIWLDRIHCDQSTDTCIGDCQKCPSREHHQCDHKSDVILECETSIRNPRQRNRTLNTCRYASPPLPSSGNSLVGYIVTCVLGVVVVIIFIISLILMTGVCLYACVCVDKKRPKKSHISDETRALAAELGIPIRDERHLPVIIYDDTLRDDFPPPSYREVMGEDTN